MLTLMMTAGIGCFPSVFREQQEALFEYDLPGDVERVLARDV